MRASSSARRLAGKQAAWNLPVERAIQLGNLMAVHALEVVGPQEFDLTKATLADRAKHAYGAEAAEEIAAHLPA